MRMGEQGNKIMRTRVTSRLEMYVAFLVVVRWRSDLIWRVSHVVLVE